MLTWKLRRRRSETVISRRSTLETTDNQFAVTSYTPKLAGDLKLYYLATRRRPDAGEEIIGGRHFRTEDAAQAACEAIC